MIIPVNENTEKIYIGHQMDNEAYSYAIDVSKALNLLGPGGTFGLRPRRPGEKNAYSSAYIELDGTQLIWTPHSEDMQLQGEGALQYAYTVGERVYMSHIWTTVICPSLSPIQDPPSVWESYLQEFERLLQEAKDTVAEIEDMVVTATVDDTTGIPTVTVTKTVGEVVELDFAFTGLKGETGEQGETGPQGPKGNVMYATFYIDEDMKLHMVIPDEYTGPTFRLVGNKLEVIL